MLPFQLEGARDLAMDLQLKVEALKRQLEDQEYERAELVDKITAERSAWDLAKSNKQSKINQVSKEQYWYPLKNMFTNLKTNIFTLITV